MQGSVIKSRSEKLTELVDSSLLVVLSLAPESLLNGLTHLSLNLLSSVIATPMPCRTPRMCLMTSGGGAEVTVDGSTAPWWTPIPRYWGEDGDGNDEGDMVGARWYLGVVCRKGG